MAEQFAVSIIIPVYNAAYYLETTILSVLSQNASWVELILVNDGSTDGSDAICQKYICNQVQYIVIPNGGAGHARNVGLNHARGDWIIFLDSDDLVAGDFFTEELRSTLKKQQTDIFYTPKVLCDFSLSGEPEIVYPEPLSQIQHHMPSLEFWSCIYRAEYLRYRQVRFFEYRKQDVESAFRFRAFSGTSRIELAPQWIFYIHRNNPSSNVNTWNWDNVLEIKARVYYALFREFDSPHEDTQTWLYTQSMYYTKQLMKQCIQYGFLENEELTVIALLKDFEFTKHPHQTVLLPTRYRVLVRLIQLLRSSDCAWKCYCGICRKKHRKLPDAKNSVAMAPDDITQIMSRLEYYTCIIKKARAEKYFQEETL